MIKTLKIPGTIRPVTIFAMAAAMGCGALTAMAQVQSEPPVRLHGHVLNALQYATQLPRTPQAAAEPLNLTVMLNWSDAAGFEAFANAFEDPASPTYHKTIRADELTARFGPSQEAYDTVLDYLQKGGFALVEGSTNRLTLTVRGTRAQAERNFSVSIADYQLGATRFHANETDPAIPAAIAPLIHSVSGFSNLGQPRPAVSPSPLTPMSISTAYNRSNLPMDGSGQTIGLIEFDNFDSRDIKNWLVTVGLNPLLIYNGTTYCINGCPPPSGKSGTTEALLDIDAVLGMAPGAAVAVFIADPGNNAGAGGYISVMSSAINRMNALTGGYGGIISTSWCLSEDGQDGVSDDDAEIMERLLRTASYSGLTVFAASGDYGSTSASQDSSGNLKMYPNRVTWPADAPHAVAVGGTTLNVSGPDNSYQSESWWTNGTDGSKGNGGYGYSWHFNPVPSWQAPFTNAFGRSVPDVAAEARYGITVCQGTLPNGQPSCMNIGGTSLATPLWAAVWALASQAESNARGTVTSASGSYLYSLYTPSSINNPFHSPSTMTGVGNDFSHVGLGSPNILNLVAIAAGPPVITSISPASGPVSGGTQVTINGKALIGVSQVLFHGSPASSFRILTDRQIVAVSPVAAQHAPDSDIRVLTPAGTSGATNADVFNYYAVITGVSPKYGPIDGGMAITVNGSGFQRGGSEFYFSGTPARSFNCHGSDTVCQVVTPAHSAGTADITLGPGSPTPSDRYTYQLPTVSNISPLIGPTTGGTRVTLYGSGLSPNMTVKFGGTVADQKTISCSSDDNSCTVTSPAYITSTVVGCSVCAAYARPNGITGPLPPSGVASVLISVVINNVTSRPLVNDEFTYAIFPEVHGISPLSGPRAGNIKVTVTGANFSVPQGSTSFLFGSSAATNVQCGSSTQCMMTVPAWNPALDPYTQVVVTAAVDGNKSQITAIFYYDVTYIGASAVPTADGATPTATDYRP